MCEYLCLHTETKGRESVEAMHLGAGQATAGTEGKAPRTSLWDPEGSHYLKIIVPISQLFVLLVFIINLI